MQNLRTGQFYGQTNATLRLPGMTLTDTEYTHERVDWHYHDNAYFTFIVQGKLIEGNKKETYHCSAGSLLFHHWQEPHYNRKPQGFTRGFHLEFAKEGPEDFRRVLEQLQGSIKIVNPATKIIFYKILQETKINDDTQPIAIPALVWQALSTILPRPPKAGVRQPRWVNQIKELLHDGGEEKRSLKNLSHALQIHPVHLSRGFPKYFNCTLGDYLRKIKLEKALALLADPNLSLTEIAFACGFADQSHFIRCFKACHGLRPSLYRRLIFAR